MKGLLSYKVDTIGHSQPCHLIQDRALEHQFFELIINLASLQPIAEAWHEAEDNCLRQTPAIIATSRTPSLRPTFQMRRNFTSCASHSAFVFARRQIFAPLRGGMAVFAPCLLNVSRRLH